MVVAELVKSAETTAMKDMLAMIMITAMPITYPKIDPCQGVLGQVWPYGVQKAHASYPPNDD